MSGIEESGTVEKGLQGDYSFSIRATLSEAWDKTNGAKWPIHLAFLYYFLVGFAIFVLYVLTSMALSEGPSTEEELSLLLFTFQVVVSIALVPLMMGIIMMGIIRSSGRKINANTIFAYFSKTLSLLITIFIMYIMIFIGFLLLILPGIYLSIAYYMALPLVVEKNMGPWQALEASRKTVTHRWFRMFGILFILSIIISISIIPLGIGLIWTLPLFVIAYGIIYRNMFGIEADTLE